MTKIIEPKKQSNIFRRPSSETGIWSWITTVDHKRIGIMYGYAAFFFLLIGGLEALVLRIQLSQPDNNFLTAAEYNAMFTMHGTTMIFLAIMPISAAFFNYLLPLQIGARDVAFPRLNALSFWIFIFGGAFLYLGSEWFISGAINVASSFGISERIIGITLVSVGTSIPELVTSLVAVYKKEKGISLGNLLGSNIFNVFAVLGITSIVTPLVVGDSNIINFDIYVMLFFAFIILPLIFIPKKFILGRIEGVFMLSFYIFYVYNLFV